MSERVQVAVRQYADRTTITVAEPLEPGHIYEYATADVYVHLDERPLHPKERVT